MTKEEMVDRINDLGSELAELGSSISDAMRALKLINDIMSDLPDDVKDIEESEIKGS